MRIICVVRQVPDAEEPIRLKESVVDLSASKLVMDTMDEYGVEEALRVRSAMPDTEVVALAVGTARSEEALRTALAMGADRAVLVETGGPLDAISTSAVVAQVAQKEAADLILLGGQQADWDSQALGPAIAARLDWPQATWTTSLRVENAMLTGTHDVGEGNETFTVQLPVVVTTQQGLNEPRYPTLPNIMKAKRKELRRETIADYGTVPKLKIVSAAIQVKERRRTILDGKDAAAAAEQLTHKLRSEAKVL